MRGFMVLALATSAAHAMPPRKVYTHKACSENFDFNKASTEANDLQFEIENFRHEAAISSRLESLSTEHSQRLRELVAEASLLIEELRGYRLANQSSSSLLAKVAGIRRDLEILLVRRDEI